MDENYEIAHYIIESKSLYYKTHHDEMMISVWGKKQVIFKWKTKEHEPYCLSSIISSLSTSNSENPSIFADCLSLTIFCPPCYLQNYVSSITYQFPPPSILPLFYFISLCLITIFNSHVPSE